VEWDGGAGALGVEGSGGKGRWGWRGVEWEGMDGGADVRHRRGIGRVGLR
jgi:hypothetical protein